MKPKTVKVFATCTDVHEELVAFHLTKPTIGSNDEDCQRYISNDDACVCRKVAERLYGGKLPKTFEDGIVTFNIARVK